MSVHSAGIILYRFIESKLQVMLVHLGGPFWAKKDDGAWSIPKGIYEKDEDPLAAAKREFREETGREVDGMFIDLGEVKQPSRKIVHAWALKHDFDTSKIVSNLFRLEWPPKSGSIQQFPEADRAQWFEVQEAREKILRGQRTFLERLIVQLGYTPENAGASHYFE
ncbi:NUDIX domain-containing protein [Nitrosomonas communis]|uniref:Predicted NTP pyrophosphohydrolase, NUDIX family n=1 Tax=Nitrosomonas communis TaxID=44574 RepID=A0A1I4JL30_9PROT|nr:NUDIX domain-containing protein [Nitrosomonas communis]SFL67260.1 Predicted NTP pyrophosphohydrolase, NUDIX family [Nitrosomonas communis]